MQNLPSQKISTAVIRKALTDREGSDRDFVTLKQLVHFIILIYHSEFQVCALQLSVLALLCTMLQTLSQEGQVSAFSEAFRLPLLVAFSTLPNEIRLKLDVPSVWNSAIVARHNLTVVSSFAYYVVTSDHLLDASFCAEAWNCFRDVLQLILHGPQHEEDECLALLVCPIITQGLIRLLQDASLRAVRFMLASPWTLTLCAELQELIENDGRSQYSKLLCGRIQPFARALLDQMICRTKNKPISMESPKITTRLILIPDEPRLRCDLIVIPVFP